MIVFRCTLDIHIPTTLSGEGAFRYGGRWNSKGVSVIYTAESRIMSILELLIRQPIDKIASNYRILPIEIPMRFIEPDLPENWKEDPKRTQRIGDDLLKVKENLIIRVPSALLSNSYNFLINPMGDNFDKVRLLDTEPILIDQRLLTALRK
jgi:RES domain-containing protein